MIINIKQRSKFMNASFMAIFSTATCIDRWLLPVTSHDKNDCAACIAVAGVACANCNHACILGKLWMQQLGE